MLQIELDLKKHCVETAIQRCYNRLLSKYFRSKGDDTDAEQKLALLQNALTLFDFSTLRTLHQELKGKSSARIVLTDNGDSTPEITINGRPIEMEPCLRKQ